MPQTVAQQRRAGLTRSPKRIDQGCLHNESQVRSKSPEYLAWREAMVEAHTARIQAELAAMEQQHPKETANAAEEGSDGPGVDRLEEVPQRQPVVLGRQ